MFELNDLTMYLPNVKIVGVGEGGCNFLKRISSMGIPNVTLVAKNNDDIKELVQNNKMKGGKEGEAKEDILNVLHDADLVFVLTSIGSDNDSEAASMVASCAKDEIKALTVAIVDISSYRGGAEHRQQTEISLQKIKDSADAVAIISNEHIHAEENKGVSNFETIDQLIYQGVQSIISLISDEGIVNIDFVDVRTMLQNAGKVAIGVGLGTGESASVEAAKKAVEFPMFDESIKDARYILLNITGSEENLSMYEVHEASNAVLELASPAVNIIWGATVDNNLGDTVKAVVIATGFEGV